MKNEIEDFIKNLYTAGMEFDIRFFGGIYGKSFRETIVRNLYPVLLSDLLRHASTAAFTKILNAWSFLMNLTRKELTEKICNTLCCSTKDGCEIVEKVISILKETLCSGEDILISGFGKFSVRSKKERVGRNPATGENMVLPARRVVRFKEADRLRERVNERKKSTMSKNGDCSRIQISSKLKDHKQTIRILREAWCVGKNNKKKHNEL